MIRSTEGAEGVEDADYATSESIIATEIVAKEHHKLFFQLKTSVRKFLGNLIDQGELKRTTDKLEDKSKQYKSVRISEMSLQDVEKCLHLQFDRHDMEMKDVQSLHLPPHLGTQSKT
jgi:flagellar biosynthesis/type III secretory pathway ATPase